MNYNQRYFELLKNYWVYRAMTLFYLILFLSSQTKDFLCLFGLLIVVCQVLTSAWSSFQGIKEIFRLKKEVQDGR